MNEVRKTNDRECYLSLARIICALAVIIIHSNACFKEFAIGECWTSAVIIDCGLGFAVPIFIMISGATLMEYSDRYSTKEYFIKRINKTLIPYIAWNIIGTICGALTGEYGYFFIYYFFLNLFGVYLCIPLFTFIKKDIREKVILYVILVSFVINYFVPFVCMLIGSTYVYQVPFEIGSNYTIYALVGYLVSKNNITFLWRLISYMSSIIGFGLHIGGTYVVSINAGHIVDTFRGYTNLPCFLSAVGVFVFIKQIGSRIKNENVIKLIEWLSSYSFPVYLIHFYIICFIIQPIFESSHSLLYRLCSPFLTFAICVGITWVIRKIPVIKKILP